MEPPRTDVQRNILAAAAQDDGLVRVLGTVKDGDARQVQAGGQVFDRPGAEDAVLRLKIDGFLSGGEIESTTGRAYELTKKARVVIRESLPTKPRQLTVEEVKIADGQYRRFPALAEWLTDVSVDEIRWERCVDILKQRRSAADDDAIERSLKIAMRAAAVDTGSIEGLYETDRGFTLTVATQSAAWTTAVAEKGEKVGELIEAQRRGYELALDAATRNSPLSEVWVRQLHEVVCKPQTHYTVHTGQGTQKQRFHKGSYKTQPNHVLLSDGTIHSYCPVDLVSTEMHRLVVELASDGFAAAHPVLQSAYAHYALVSVHPFADGNGRVARAFASVYMLRAQSVPLLIFADETKIYFDALAAADRGNDAPFATFIGRVACSALMQVADTLRTAMLPTAEESVEQLQGVLQTHGGLTYQEMDEVGVSVLGLAQECAVERIAELTLPKGVTARITQEHGGGRGAPEGYRPIVSQKLNVTVYFTSTAPAQVNIQQRYFAFIATSPGIPELLLVTHPGDSPLELALHEVHPSLTSGGLRVRTWIDGNVAWCVQHLMLGAQQALTKAGYLPKSG